MKKFLLLLLFPFFFSSCVGGGARGELYFEEAVYPVSISKGTFLNETGTLAKESDYEVVGKFSTSYTAWAFFWGFASLENHIELGERINTQVKQAGGDAVKNLTVHVQAGLLNLTPVLSLLPFWPNTAVGTVSGDIIRYKLASEISVN